MTKPRWRPFQGSAAKASSEAPQIQAPSAAKGSGDAPQRQAVFEHEYIHTQTGLL